MQFDVVTLFPEMIRDAAAIGVVGRAIETGQVGLDVWNPRDFTHDRHRTVDDRPYGGGPGMVMKPEPLSETLQAIRAQAQGPIKTICMSPQGRPLDQAAVRLLAECPHLVLVAGRYEGIDERWLQQEIDEEWSIGDYVLSGGELAALVMIDAITRTLPGVLGHADSADQDSYESGLLDYPHYTRPESWQGMAVPSVLLSGDHEQIRRWREQQALGRTWLRRPDLLEKIELTEQQQLLLEQFKRTQNK